MKYKIGDKVRVKTWDKLAKEFGVLSNGWVETNIYFNKKDEQFVAEHDRRLTISHIFDNGRFCAYEKHGGKYWSSDIIEGYAFEYGDEVEVSYTGEKWTKRIFLCWTPCGRPITYVGTGVCLWENIRPVTKKRELTLQQVADLIGVPVNEVCIVD